MPKYTGMWTMTQQAQALAGGTWQSPAYYRAQYVPTVEIPRLYSNSGSLFSFGNATVGGNAGVSIIKYSNSGDIVLQRAVTLAGSALYAGGMEADSEGNLLIAGRTGAGEASLIKLTSAGAITWQRKLAGGSYGGNAFTDVVLDSAGSSYAVGATRYTGSTQGYVAKYDAYGVFQWQGVIGGDGDSGVAAAAYDPSGFIYITARGITSGYRFATFVKINAATRTPVWTRSLGQYAAGFNYNSGTDIALDASGNVFASVYSAYSGLNAGTLVKFDSAGTQQWYTIHTNNGTSMYYERVAVGASNDVYAAGTTANGLVIVKFNSGDGSIVWSRSLTNAGVPLGCQGLSIDSEDNITVAGSNGTNTYIFKLPADGSKTGTLTVNSVNFTYAAFTATRPSSSNANFISGGLGYSLNSVEALTSSTTSYTASNTALTTSITYI